MNTESLCETISSARAGLFFVRSTARSVLEQRPIRGTVELLLVAEDDADRTELQTRLEGVLAEQQLMLSLSIAPSVTHYLTTLTVPFNQVSVSVDEPESVQATIGWDDYPTVGDGAEPGDLLDWCLRISELGDAGRGDVEIEAHPSAARVLSLPRAECMRRLTQILVSRYAVDGLRCLDALGLMQLLLPELSGLKGFHLSSPFHHKDVYEHTLQVVSQSVPTTLLRWSALLHDIGKLHTRSFTPNGQVHFFKHDELGAYLSDGVAARLSFPESLSQDIHQLVLLHLRPGLYTPQWSDAAIRRLVKEAGSVLNALFDLARADNTTKRMSKRQANLRNVKALSDRCKSVILASQSLQIKLPSGLGHAIKVQFQLESGPRIGELCALCSEGLRDGRLPHDATVEHHLAFLRNAPEVLNRLSESASSLSN